MSICYIVVLILFGVLFLVAELVFLPGVSIGAVLSLLCYGSAVYLAFSDYGLWTGVAVIVVVFLLSLAAAAVSLRAKTWQRLSLRQEIDSSSMPSPQNELKIGDRGVTLSRLAPMGKAEFGGRVYESKSLDAFVDPHREVEIIGFENFNVIVKTIDQNQ